jgi:hypothetical protein
MMGDVEIAKAAASIIKTHGADAAPECARISIRWAARGDQEAAELWARIRKSVLEQELPQAACIKLGTGSSAGPSVG